MIIKSFGFESFQSILTILDSNVDKIELNIVKSSYNIYSHNVNIPIAASNLSFGTKKILNILASSLKLFNNGGIMVIDEIENGLHLSLVELLVKFYSKTKINKKNAQLLLTTHVPVFAEEKIIRLYNIFIYDNKNIHNLKHFSNRTSDIKQIVKRKNYYDDNF